MLGSGLFTKLRAPGFFLFLPSQVEEISAFFALFFGFQSTPLPLFLIPNWPLKEKKKDGDGGGEA